jgi:hypothetical protein
VTQTSRQLTDLAETCLVGAYDIACSALLQQLGLTTPPGWHGQIRRRGT